MPHCVTIERAIDVTRSRSLLAPVRDVAETDFLGDATAQQRNQVIAELGAGHQVTFFVGQT